jgi:hypothetical protein
MWSLNKLGVLDLSRLWVSISTLAKSKTWQSRKSLQFQKACLDEREISILSQRHLPVIISDNIISDNIISDNIISDNNISDNNISDNIISDNIVSDNIISDNKEKLFGIC